MFDEKGLSRRDALMPSLLLPLTAAGAGLSTRASRAQEAASNSTVLVAYFSRTGNTRLIARQIKRALDAELFEIETAEVYPEDYQAMVAQAEREREAEYEPPLRGSVANLASYQTIFLGFPIWGMTAPSPIRSFLTRHNLSGKTLVPFITHGGYGLGNSLLVVAEHAPRARLLGEFSKSATRNVRLSIRSPVGWAASGFPASQSPVWRRHEGQSHLDRNPIFAPRSFRPAQSPAN
jgi:flavodoxin